MLNTHPAIEVYVDSCVKFVLCHRKSDTKAFRDWTEEQIRDTFRHACLNAEMCSISDIAGNIVGVCNGEANEKKKLFFVNNILAIKGCMPSFLRMFDTLFPGFKLAGNRYGKNKIYDVKRLKMKFTKTQLQ